MAERICVMNVVTMMGYLTKDPTTKHVVGATGVSSISRFTLAINRWYSGGRDGCDFVPVVAFGKNGEFVENNFHKGMRMAVAGRLQSGKYTKADGTVVYTLEVVAQQVYFADSKSEQEEDKNDEHMLVESSFSSLEELQDAEDGELPF